VLIGDAGTRPSPISTAPLLSCVVDLEPDLSPPTSGIPVTSSLENDVTRQPPNGACTATADAAAAKREFLYHQHHIRLFVT